MTTITALPTPPSRQDPTNFNDRADAFLGALPTFVTQTNAVASETNTASANAVAANNAVIAATNITKWVSGTTYAEGAVVWSPINGLAYRRITASGSGTADPSLDSTNYKQVNGTGDVSTTGDQTIAGNKTFTGSTSLQTVTVSSITGTGAEQSGMIAHFAMTTAPAGWLRANGSAVSRATYATLFAAIGTTFGSGDGSTTFNLPDLRGEFVRGLDDGRGIDALRTLGSSQAAQDNNLAQFESARNPAGENNAAGTEDVPANGLWSGWRVTGRSLDGDDHHIRMRNTGLADPRPRNVALLACIKY